MKLPFLFAPVPDVFYAPIAQIAILWGQFEHDFGNLLAAMIAANGAGDSKVLFHSFENKAKRMHREMRCFDYYPLIAIYLKSIIADAVIAQSRRNLLLHGHVSIRIDPPPTAGAEPIYSIDALGRRKGMRVFERFSVEGLTDLAYDLGHLAGRITMFTSLVFPIPNPISRYLSPFDELWLLNFIKRYHPEPLPPPPEP